MFTNCTQLIFTSTAIFNFELYKFQNQLKHLVKFYVKLSNILEIVKSKVEDMVG